MTDTSSIANNALPPDQGTSELWPACRLSRLIGKPSDRVDRRRPGRGRRPAGHPARQPDARRRRRLAEDARLRAARPAAPARGAVVRRARRRVEPVRRDGRPGDRVRRRAAAAPVDGVRRPVRVVPDAGRLLRPLRPRRRAAARVAGHDRAQARTTRLRARNRRRTAGARRDRVSSWASARTSRTSTARPSAATTPVRRSSSASRCAAARWCCSPRSASR